LGPEEGVGADKKSLYILHSVVKRATAEMKDNKATGDDDVPGNLVKLFKENSLSTMTQQISNVYKTGEWPKNFTKVTVIALTLRRLMSYIYGAPILDVSRSHTTTQHSR